MNLEDILTQKHALLSEMVGLTKDLFALADGELGEEDLDSLVATIGRRGELMSQVEKLDQAASACEPGDCVQCAEILVAIGETLKELNAQQDQLVAQLSARLAAVTNDYDKVKAARRGLKGYYNQQVATTPSFIDKKR